MADGPWGRGVMPGRAGAGRAAAGADAELDVDVGQVRIDGVDAEVQLRGDLLLAEDQATAGRGAAAGDPVQLRGRRLGPARVPQLLEPGPGLLERLLGRGPLFVSALSAAQDQQRPAASKPSLSAQ